MGDFYADLGIDARGDSGGNAAVPETLHAARRQVLCLVSGKHTDLVERYHPQIPLTDAERASDMAEEIRAFGDEMHAIATAQANPSPDDLRLDAMADLRLAKDLRDSIRESWPEATRAEWADRADAIELRARTELGLTSDDQASRAHDLLGDHEEWHPRDRWGLSATAEANGHPDVAGEAPEPVSEPTATKAHLSAPPSDADLETRCVHAIAEAWRTFPTSGDQWRLALNEEIRRGARAAGIRSTVGLARRVYRALGLSLVGGA